MPRPLSTRPFINTGQMYHFFQGVGIKKNIHVAINNNHWMEIKYFLFFKDIDWGDNYFLSSLKFRFRSYVVMFTNSIYKEDVNTVRWTSL